MFSSHIHAGGEEFLVLSGSFHDQNGDYLTGYYVRNPIGTSHAPWAGPEGCEIFVKLQQFDARDTKQFCIDTHSAEWIKDNATGCMTMPLHHFKMEKVALQKWHPRTTLHEETREGLEILILEGSLQDVKGDYPKETWLRYPPGPPRELTSGQDGALIYIKTGHLGKK